MAEIALAAAQTLFAALQFFEVKKICTKLGYKSQLEDLKKTVTTIQNVLADAESKVLTNEARGYIEELKDAVYDADDLFDEVVTRLELKELEGSLSKRGEFFQKFRSFFLSDKNQVGLAYRMYHKVKKIQKKLKAIVDDHQKYQLSVDYKPICMRGEETCSYVNVKDIIGRDNDQRAIKDKLTKSKDQDFRFLTIVGVGGLGKTALAQVVYNDQKLKKEFGTFMFWVCVSDQDKMNFDLKDILCKILELVTHEKSFNACSLETVQKEFHKNIGGKKYLLVLDDVWNEDREKWVDLEKLLILGQGGSRVLVTTRSEMTATIIGDGWTYKLQGLSPEDSWHLFEMTSFKEKSNQQVANHIEMMNIGNRIVEKCNNVPLAIKVVGSLLFGQDMGKWKSFEKKALAKIDNDENKIMSVLKLSYYNLPPSLKSCFSYCAVFPKDFRIRKELVINLWMAQGYIMPLNRDQSIEDVAKEHFSILLRRCFFQDVEKDECDNVNSFKLHDLMHDVAQEVGGEEIQVLSSVANNIGDRTRHVSILDARCFDNSSNWTNLRSLITIGYMKVQVGNWRSLRVLSLVSIGLESSINSIGKLQHLRYVDLSHYRFDKLPSSITKLHNLQTLILYDCCFLEQLPHDFCKLIKLRHLNLRRCDRLTCMPLGLDKLTGLRVLSSFVVGGKENRTEKQCDDELKDLGTLTNLTGCIRIKIREKYRNVEVMNDMNSGGYLSKLPGLNEVYIHIDCGCVEAEAVIEKLQPHPNVKKFFLRMYKGRTIPTWGRAENNWAISLPNLVHIQIDGCRNLVSLPSFGELPFLRSLTLMRLDNLEYMEKTSSSTNEANGTTFFPSLEMLEIIYCKKLNGWFRGEGLADADYGLTMSQYRFSCLSKLCIADCNKLTSFLPCPSIKDIQFDGVNQAWQLIVNYIMGRVEQGEDTFGDCTRSSSCLATLRISNDNELEDLSDYQSVFDMCASSLRNLQIDHCNNLTAISGGLQYLTSLESLIFEENNSLNFSEHDDEESMMQWKSMHQSLRSLSFNYVRNMTSLPKGMQYLTSLQTLQLNRCYKLNDLPEWISCLSSLQHLAIFICDGVGSFPEGIRNLTSLQTLTYSYLTSNLRERCREPDGEDWPKIQHIPNISFKVDW